MSKTKAAILSIVLLGAAFLFILPATNEALPQITKGTASLASNLTPFGVTIGGTEKEEETVISLNEKEKPTKPKKEEDASVTKKTTENKEESKEKPSNKKEEPEPQKVDINSASEKDLTIITGIGEATAKKIIDYREESTFYKLEDLENVSGIGEITVENIKEESVAYTDKEKPKEEEEETSKEEEKEEEKNEKEEKPEKVDINSASKEDLTIITGIGEATAEKIIDYREENTFYKLEDLENISGVGEATIKNIKEEGVAYTDKEKPEEKEEDASVTKKTTEKKEKEKENSSNEKEKPEPEPEKVDINNANKEKLTIITGIGETTAEKIIDYRKNYAFYQINNLERISGIGETTIKNIKEEGIAYTDKEKPEEEKELKEEKESEIGKEEETEKEEKNEKEEKPEKVDINSASKEDLTIITGIGEATAEKIIDYRKENAFYKLEDLENISGVGEATIKNIKKEGIAYTDKEKPEEEETNKEEEKKEAPQKVDINSANEKDLTIITGIGEATAKKIIDYREESTFYKLEDLENVSGIGEITVENIKEESVAYTDKEKPKEEEEETSKEEEKEEEPEKVDINNANKEKLKNITGIGKVTAEKIIDYREENTFYKLEDLENVSGIGEITVENIKEEGVAYTDKENPEEEEEKEEEPEKVDINNANKEKLTIITGIGETTAEKIIDYRKENTFYKLEDLENVSGIGEITVENIKEEGVAYVK